MRHKSILLLLFAIATLFFTNCTETKATTNTYKDESIHKNWRIFQNSTKTNGKDLSIGKNIPEDHISFDGPTTVLNALSKSGKIKDIYFSNNLEKVDKKQFEQSWWYVNNFDISKAELNSMNILNLDGINYRANLWLNGQLIKDTNELVGAFKTYHIAIDKFLKEGKNFIAIEVFKPQPGDFTIGFVDWAPTPADENMGVWRPVTISRSKRLQVSNPFIVTNLSKNNTIADLDLHFDILNPDGMNYLSLKGTIDGKTTFTQDFKAEKSGTVVLTSNDNKALHIENPELWWPHDMGKPTMHTLELAVMKEGDTVDFVSMNFGIREVSDYFNKKGHRGYKVNGKEVLIKGGGWVDDLLLGNTYDYDLKQVMYTKSMGLNCIRFEGFWGTDQHIYDLCDEHGILAMVGFSCHWEWQEYLRKKFDESKNFGGIVTKQEQELVARYFKDQVKWLRNHPAIFSWTFGSDFLHRPALEKRYLKILAENDPKRPYLGAAKTWTSEITGPTGVKMEGPYDWVPPVYWYTDTIRGGAYGFNTETGPGAQPPIASSMKLMLPEANHWPIDSMWDYHSGRHAFKNMDRYLKAMHNRYWKPQSLEEFSLLSQMASYEAIRPMFEAFELNRPNSTGVVQWMLNSAWPETYWQLYDYYLVPTGAYYGTKRACQNVNPIFNYDTKEIIVVAGGDEKYTDIKTNIIVFDKNSKPVYFSKDDLYLQFDSIRKVKVADLSDVLKNGTYFISINLYDESNNNKHIGEDFYWYNTKQDVVDPVYENSSWIYTPTVEFTSFSDIKKMPKSEVKITTNNPVKTDKNLFEVEIIVENKSNSLSICNELILTNSESLPITYEYINFSDNYFSLLPNEKKTIKLLTSYSGKDISIKHQSIN